MIAEGANASKVRRSHHRVKAALRKQLKRVARRCERKNKKARQLNEKTATKKKATKTSNSQLKARGIQ